MAEIPDKQPSKNHGLKRSSSDKLKDRESKRQRREDISVQPVPGPNLPVAESPYLLASMSIIENQMLVTKQEASSSDSGPVVDAAKSSVPVSKQEPAVENVSTVNAANYGGVCDVASSETLVNQKLPAPSPVVNGNTKIPDLNEIAPPEEKSSGGDDDKEEDFHNGTWVTSESFERLVKLIRKLESDALLTSEFRMKFLSWFGLRATENECRVVSTFIQFFPELDILAEQLNDALRDIIFDRK